MRTPRGKEYLPNERIYSSGFAEQGRSDVVLIEVISVADREVLKLVFESTNSPWRQGVWLATDQVVVINNVKCPSAELWYDTAPREVLIQCRTEENILWLYNIWDDGNGRQSQAWTSGMLVEELANGWRYRCNDIGFETNFDKLVFRLERTGRPGKRSAG